MSHTDPALADELVRTIRTFVEKEVVPVASELEHRDEYPAALIRQMAEFGLFGAVIPEEYGGLGLDVRTYARLIEEISVGWMSLTGALNSHMMAATLIRLHGTDDQRSRLLPQMATGQVRGCLSLSEPDAGSDTRSLRCKATPDGDEYILSGTKMWVTNGERAGVVALAAKTPEGITCFMVEKEPGPQYGGITVSRTIGKLGYKGLETVEMAYNDHRVPASSVLGGVGDGASEGASEGGGLGRGLAQILGALELGRVNIAARGVGVARAAFEAAIAYAQQRRT
ncbi:MAG TPA: acyl-CoA dehydrogenase family protein, partial [Acidimicrobiales bacterium]